MVIVDAAAGLLAGASSTMLLHPLDLAKTRMQINGGGKTLDVVRQSYREGRLRGVYRGLGTNLIGGAAGWGFYFAWYGQIKRWVAGPSRERLSGTEYLLSAAAAGLLTSACTNPIWVIKTRMLNTAVTANGAYQSFSDGLTKIAAEEGMRGLWRGLVPSLLGVAHGSVQFGLYEMMKDQKKNMAGVLSQLDVLKLSAVSKLGATLLTYPYQVVRSRMQWQHRGTVFDTLRCIRQEGWTSFYRGLAPNLARVVPSTCVTLCVYEGVKRTLYDDTTI